MTANFPDIRVIIDGENRVLAHFKAIERDAARLNARLKKQFNATFRQVEKELAQISKRFQSQSRSGRGGGLSLGIDDHHLRQQLKLIADSFNQAATAAQKFSQGSGGRGAGGASGQGGGGDGFQGWLVGWVRLGWHWKP